MVCCRISLRQKRKSPSLAAMTPDQIKDLLNAAGDRFSFQDPTTWPAQSELAAQGEWDKLKKWQDELKGGKLVVVDADGDAIENTPAATTAAVAATTVAAAAAAAVANGEEE